MHTLLLLPSSTTVVSSPAARVTGAFGRSDCPSLVPSISRLCRNSRWPVVTQAGRSPRGQQQFYQQPAPPPQQQQQQQQGRPRQQLPQPDPAADDLDLLAAAAAGATVVTPTPQHISLLPLSTTAAAAPINSIPDAEPKYALPAGRRPRYAAADKLQLSGAQMRDIGSRLRTARRGAGPVLRVWRYGIDDLRLYQALDLADLEGRVVVVDSTADADVVLTTYSKRTRKNVNLATAKRAAAGAGVPLLVLPAVSAQRLVEAVGPLLGLPTVEDGWSAVGASSAGVGATLRQAQQPQQQSWAGQGGDVPRLLRWDELEGDGSDELLQLMWACDTQPTSTSPSSSGGCVAGTEAAGAAGEAGVTGACCPSPRWHAWCAAQAASPGAANALWAAVRDADVEDARDGAVPANPTARAGERHRLLKPLRPYSRVKRRRLRRDLAERQADY